MTDSPDLGVGTANRDRPLRTGFGITPNQLWTLPDLTPNQRCLLGWLHSHADNYLSRLTLNRIGKEYGCGTRAGDLIRALQDAGWVRLIEASNGHRAHVVLLSEPWEDLLHHSQIVNATVHTSERPHSQIVNGNHSQIVNAEKNTVEDQPEHQERTPALALVGMSTVGQGQSSFDVFWEQYPRKQGKAEARKRWARMKPDDRHEALISLPDWCRYYRTLDQRFVPHASTWLNQRRWEDDIPEPAQQQRTSPNGMGAIRRRIQALDNEQRLV